MSISSDLPPSGRIDVHSHLLPSRDDGCTGVSDSMRCVKRLIEEGFVGTICTPHVWRGMFAHNTPAEVERAVAQLREEIDAAGFDYRLWAGGELRIAADTVQWLQEIGVPTLGDSRCVLLDYWGDSWPSYADAVCRWLLEKGYQPILAHPERMGLPDHEFDTVVRSLAEMGVLLQGNVNSLAGIEGAVAAERVRRLLREDRYYLMALDMHGPDSLDGRLQGLALLEAEAGPERAARYFEEHPRAILANRA
jgi:protein-tyrosine phosphatase